MPQQLTTGGIRDPFLPRLLTSIRQANEIDLAVAFVKSSGLALLFSALSDAILIRPDDTERKLGSTTRIVLTRNLVLGVGTTSVTSRTTQTEDGDTATEEVARTILTIAVTQEQAEKLILADRTTELNFALLTDDSQTEDNDGAYPRDIFPELYRGVAP